VKGNSVLQAALQIARGPHSLSSLTHSSIGCHVADVVPSALPLRTKSCPLLTVKPASIHRSSGAGGLPPSASTHGASLKFAPMPASMPHGGQRGQAASMLPHILSGPHHGDSRPTVPLPRSHEHRNNFERKYIPHRRSSSGQQVRVPTRHPQIPCPPAPNLSTHPHAKGHENQP